MSIINFNPKPVVVISIPEDTRGSCSNQQADDDEVVQKPSVSIEVTQVDDELSSEAIAGVSEEVVEIKTICTTVVVDEGQGRWITHYSSSHRILLVGEGDFSFAACLATAFGMAPNIIATSLDSQGICTCMHEYIYIYICTFVYMNRVGMFKSYLTRAIKSCGIGSNFGVFPQNFCCRIMIGLHQT